MTATNHALTGALIGLIIGQPLIAVPAAIGSHFVCDVLPHFGRNISEKDLFRSDGFRNYLIVEAILCGLIVGLMAALRPEHWLLAIICAFLAAAPDLLSLNRYLTIRNHHQWRGNIYTRFAKSIQWFERPIGAVVEGAWFAGAIILLVPFLR